MEFTDEVYHVAFDKALWSADEALDAMKRGPRGDLQLNDRYRAACRKIMLLTERWVREGYATQHGTLVDNWYRRIREGV